MTEEGLFPRTTAQVRYFAWGGVATCIVRVETSKNAAENTGFDEVAVTLEKREIPGTGSSDADTAGPAAVLNLYLPQAPTAEQADTLQYYRGEREPAPDDPTLTETQADSLAFAGVINGLQTEITLLNFAGLTAQADTLTARISYTIKGVQTSQDLTLTETGPETRLFRLRFADPTPETLGANVSLPVAPTAGVADSLQYYSGVRSPLPDASLVSEARRESGSLGGRPIRRSLLGQKGSERLTQGRGAQRKSLGGRRLWGLSSGPLGAQIHREESEHLMGARSRGLRSRQACRAPLLPQIRRWIRIREGRGVGPL